MATLKWTKELGLTVSLSESESRTIQNRVVQMGKLPGIRSEDQDAVATAYFKMDFGDLTATQADGLLVALSQELSDAGILKYRHFDLTAIQDWLFHKAVEELLCSDNQNASQWLAEEFGNEEDDFEDRIIHQPKSRGSVSNLVVRTPIGRNSKGRMLFKKSFVHGGLTPPLGRILNRENKCIEHGHKPKVGSLECSEMHKVVYLAPKIVSGDKNSTGSSDAAGGTAYRQDVFIIGLSEHWTSLQCKGWPDMLQVGEEVIDNKKVPILESFADWCNAWTELQFNGRIHGDEEDELTRLVGSIAQSTLCLHWQFMESKKNGFQKAEYFIQSFERAFSGGKGKKYIPGLDAGIRLEELGHRWNRMVAERCCKIAGIPFDRQSVLAAERVGKRIKLEEMIPTEIYYRHRQQAVKELLGGTVRGDRLQSSSQKSSTQSATFSQVQKSGRGKDGKRRTKLDENNKSTKVNGARMFTWPEGAVLAQMKIVVRTSERLVGLEKLLSENGVQFRWIERKEVCRDLRELETLKESRYVVEDVVDRKFGQELFGALQFDFTAMLQKELSLGHIKLSFDKVVNGNYTDAHRDKMLLERGFRSWMERATQMSVQNMLARLYGRKNAEPWITIPQKYFPAEVSVQVRVPESRLESRLELAAMKVEELGLPVTETTLGLALRKQTERLEFMAEMLVN